ncbi:MAG: glycosyltransferase family 4 protein [Desulfopila sp.]
MPDITETPSKPALAYVLKGYPRISETFISNEILQLEKLGFSITIFAMRKPRENFHHASVEQIQAPVFYLPTYFFKNFFRLLSPNLRLCFTSPRRYFKAVVTAIKRFRRTRKSATFKHLFQAGYMVDTLQHTNAKIDQLHGHFAHSPTSVTMFASLLSTLPFSFTAHAKDIYTSNKEQLREKIAKAAFVVTCTQYNADYLRGIAGRETTPLHCIYHGIDTSLFTSGGARVHCSPPYSLLTVARLTEKKGLPTIYQALAQLDRQGVDFQHNLIGDGDDREAIIALIEELGLGNKCRWLGTKNHEEVLDHFRRSDLFVLGCRIAQSGDRDGIPNVLVESLAMGIPALSTSVSAIPELVIDGRTGRTVPPEDSGAMAQAIMEMLSDPALRRWVIEEGQKLVRQHFDNSTSTAQLAEVFIKNSQQRSPL